MANRHVLDHQLILLNSLEDWIRMLELFSKASGLIASIYLPDGSRIIGPYSGSSLGKYLVESGRFDEGHLCNLLESQQVLRSCLNDEFDDIYFDKALTVKMLPIKADEHIVGVVVFGWAFPKFPDPLECNRLSKSFGKSEIEFWQEAGKQSPISKEKLATFEEMLSLLCSTLMQQLIYLTQANTYSKLKDELLAVVSHELKTPLTSILLRIQMLKRNTITPEKMVQFTSSLEASARIQARLIEDLLDAAKVITGKFSINPLDIDLQDILNDSIETIKDSAEKKQITINFAGMEEKFPFYGDAFRLQQVFWNLLSNSVKFTPIDGVISVKLTGNISSYVIRISDNGSGIEPSFIPFLFDRFAQHESKIGKPSSGLGIGLSLVKTIVDLHKGTVEVESGGIGQGTTFEIRLDKVSTLEKPKEGVAEDLDNSETEIIFRGDNSMMLVTN